MGRLEEIDGNCSADGGGEKDGKKGNQNNNSFESMHGHLVCRAKNGNYLLSTVQSEEFCTRRQNREFIKK